ncbi:MAG: TlpA family protein disulfide reductase [Phycisphaerales bacterium]|nr:TlpA family protein disulfide reductase [Phycisphaerales bacterium]
MRSIRVLAAMIAAGLVSVAVAQQQQQQGIVQGKPAPEWNITSARGMQTSAKLADYRGRWVVLDFWGFWCPPCVGRSIPAWMTFAEKHKDQNQHFAIITVHETNRGVTTPEQLEPKLAQLTKSKWNGKELPFPVIFDVTNKTVAAYRVNAYPTAVLIDPAGNVAAVEVGAGDVIEKRLAAELVKLQPAKKADEATVAADAPKEPVKAEKPKEAAPAAGSTEKSANGEKKTDEKSE